MQQSKTQSIGTLTLTGKGQAHAKPDMASISLGVLTTATTAEEAVRENATIMSRVIAKVKALGIPAEDIQTIGIGISPVMDLDDKSPTHGQILSYRVEDALGVKSSVEKAAKVLDAGVAAGANVADVLSFGLRDEAKYKEEALTAAVEAARADADVVAEAMRATIKRARNVEVISAGTQVGLRRLGLAIADATPIEAGNLTITASVRVVYDFRLRR